MNDIEHSTLVRIEDKLNKLVKTSEHRLTEHHVNIKNQQKKIDNCVEKNTCTTFTGDIKRAVGFLYAIVLTVIAAICYKWFES